MRHRASWILASILALATSGLAVAQSKQEPQPPPKEERGPEVNRLPRGELPKQQVELTNVAPVDPKSYQIGAEDVLFIRVWQEPNFTGPAFVRPDGKITMPLMGDVQAAGLSPAQLSDELVKRLAEFMKTKPDVNVFVQQVNSKKFFISGEVNRTGAFPLVKPTTILEALAEAGGFRDFASTKKIKIVRGDKRLKFNYKEVIAGKKLEQNILVEPGDMILVP